MANSTNSKRRDNPKKPPSRGKLADVAVPTGCYGLPAMGIRGIGLATVVIQVFGCIYLAVKLARTALWRAPAG